MKSTSHRLIKCFILLVAIVFSATYVSAQDKPDNGASRARQRTMWRHLHVQQSPEWYKTDEALKIADNILLYQTDAGAWEKNVNLAVKPSSEEYLQELKNGGKANTIDNGATTTPMRYIAKMVYATGDEKYKESFLRGVDYLLAAQYPNGGWPQFFPLREAGYYSHITYNDNAMMSVMFLLRSISKGEAPYNFIDSKRRNAAKEALKKGMNCILLTQIEVNGKLTAWCAQYDQITLEPAWARAYEPPSLSGSESVRIVQFLMEIENPNEEIEEAIHAAIKWFETAKITGIRYKRGRSSDGKFDAWIEEDPDASPIWARFYDIETNKAIFLGRDSEIHYAFNKIERERRTGYAYYGRWPEKLLNQEYPAWLENKK